MYRGLWPRWRVNAHITQGTLLRRPHPKLNPNHETTLAMPEHDRYQYQQARNQDIHMTTEANEFARSSKEAPLEAGQKNEGSLAEEKKIMMGVKKVYCDVLGSAIDVKLKLGKFQDNKYFIINFLLVNQDSFLSHIYWSETKQFYVLDAETDVVVSFTPRLI